MALVEYRSDNGIGYVSLNNPEKLNALSDDMALEFNDVLYKLNDDESVHVGILSGNGRAFCSGADVKQKQLRPQEEMRRLGGPTGRNAGIHTPFLRSSNSKPMIAAVHGYVFGVAVRLALYCDMLVASRGTKFQVTEVARGVNGIPFWMLATQRGAGVFATKVALTGKAFLAEEAYSHGLVTCLAEPGEHITMAEELATEILKNPPLAVRAVVECRRSMIEEVEARAYSMRPRTLHLSEDFRESALAFVEKRKPVFKGR